MKVKSKINDNKAIREESSKELMKNILPLGNNVLTKLEYTLLEEVLINNKSFGELTSSLKLTTDRQHTMLVNSIKRMCKVLDTVIDNERAYNALQIELSDVRKQLTTMKGSIRGKKKLSPETLILLPLSLEKVGLPPRVRNICAGGKIFTVADLVKCTRKNFGMLRNSGKKTIQEVEGFLRSKGLSWGMKI